VSCRCRGDAGVVAGGDAVVFGVLLFVVGSLMITNLWSIVDARTAAQSAARESARTVVETDDVGSVVVQAEVVAVATWQSYGRTSAIGVTLDGSMQRCAPITVTVTAQVPLVRLPLIGWDAGRTEVSASHTEIVDPFRSGVPGQAAC
jgi:hypothetical protein